MEDQGDQIAALLDETSPETAPHACVPGFRYAVPRTGEELKRFQKAERIIFFIRYHSTVVRLADQNLCDAYRWLKDIPELKDKICDWPMVGPSGLYRPMGQAYWKKFQWVFDFPEFEGWRSACTVPHTASLKLTVLKKEPI